MVSAQVTVKLDPAEFDIVREAMKEKRESVRSALKHERTYGAELRDKLLKINHIVEMLNR